MLAKMKSLYIHFIGTHVRIILEREKKSCSIERKEITKTTLIQTNPLKGRRREKKCLIVDKHFLNKNARPTLDGRRQSKLEGKQLKIRTHTHTQFASPA